MSPVLLFIAAFSVAAASRPHKRSVSQGANDRDVSDVTGLTALGELSSTAGLEDHMMALLKTDSANTPELLAFVKRIKDLVITDMMPKIVANRDSQQDEVNKMFKAFERCPAGLTAAKVDLDKLFATFDSERRQHLECRKAQSSLATANDARTAAQKAADLLQLSKCAEVTDLDNNRNQISGTCAPSGNENYGTMAGRLKRAMETAENSYTQKVQACHGARAAAQARAAESKNSQEALTAKKKECDTEQGQMDSVSCSHVTAWANACKDLGTCYDQSWNTFESAKKTAKAQQASLKTEMGAIKRLECLLDVFAVDHVGEARATAMKACDGADYTNELERLLSLNLPQAPAKASCSVPPDGVGSGDYVRAQYGELKTLHASAQAIPCTATCCQDPEGLLAYYPLNADCKDARGGSPSRDAVVVAAAGSVTARSAGSFFTGGAYCRADWATTHTWGSALSVCVRFQLGSGTTSNNRFMGIVTNGYSSGGSWEIRMGREGCQTGTCDNLGGGVRTATSPLSWDATGHDVKMGEWVHVCMTYDGQAYTFYVNGVQRSSSPNDKGALIQGAKPIYIGIADGSGDGSKEWFDGVIQHVRIYSQSLSSAAVLRIYSTDK